MSCISDVSSKEETTKIDPIFGPQMGLFFFVWFPPSVSSPGEEKPLKNDFGAKQAHAESEGLPIKGFLRNPPQWVPMFWDWVLSAQFTRLNLGREIPSCPGQSQWALRVGYAD